MSEQPVSEATEDIADMAGRLRDADSIVVVVGKDSGTESFLAKFLEAKIHPMLASRRIAVSEPDPDVEALRERIHARRARLTAHGL